MNTEAYLEDLKNAPFYRGQITHVENIPARPAVYGVLEKPLHPDLSTGLKGMGLKNLYVHQAEAVNAARDDEHVTVVTATASGKTLCYNIPVLEAILNDRNARALYLFPTKALAQDQLGKLNDFGLFPTVRFAAYDGDTPQTERKILRKSAHIILTNPDMLHVGILPSHSYWSSFFSNLKYVVVDELHSYRGVFGAHVAFVMRRLRRICAYYGVSPRFLCCSATIANPDELTENLIGIKNPIVINQNGAPSGPRSFVFWNPPFIDNAQEERRSPHIESTSLFTDLVRHGIRNITFAKARKSAELILRYAREDFEHTDPHLLNKIRSYRSGYEKEERRAIENGLFNGSLIGVTATNALELGVDVGGLDATVLTGFPGTISSAWQQAGRAGRSENPSLSIMVAFNNPLDQFLMRHPEYFFGKPHECAVIDVDNPKILSQHLLCAASERVLIPADLIRFGKNSRQELDKLVLAGKLLLRGGKWYYLGDGHPAGDVNIRTASDGTYSIVDRERDNRVIGTIDIASASKTVHPGAIYLHQGETYLIENLNSSSLTAIARLADVNYYTEPREISFTSIAAVRSTASISQVSISFGNVVVTNQVVGYRQKRLYSDEVVSVEDLDLPEATFETEGFWITLPPEITVRIEGLNDLHGSIHAIEHAAIGMMPLLSICDRWDIGGVSNINHPDTALPTIFIYDAYPGGIGIAESTFPNVKELLNSAYEVIKECQCSAGCPSCIHSPKCGTSNVPLDKAGAIILLETILEK